MLSEVSKRLGRKISDRDMSILHSRGWQSNIDLVSPSAGALPLRCNLTSHCLLQFEDSMQVCAIRSEVILSRSKPTGWTVRITLP